MKKRINLLLERKKKAISEETAHKITRVGTVLGVILFISFIVSVILQVFQFRDRQKLLDNKLTLLEYLDQHKQEAAQFSAFSTRTKQLNTSLKDDAQFLPYYNLLTNLVNTSSEGAALDSMTIDKDKSTDFSVNFVSLSGAYEFIRFIESNKFLDNFTALTLNSFSLIQGDNNSSDKGYQLSFSGKFKIIDNGTNP